MARCAISSKTCPCFPVSVLHALRQPRSQVFDTLETRLAPKEHDKCKIIGISTRAQTSTA